MPYEAVTYRSRWRFRLEQWRRGLVPWLLEDQIDRGLGGPPNNWRSSGPIAADRGEKDNNQVYARFGNDAFDIMIGERWMDGGKEWERWMATLPAPAFRRLALWYLWRWAWGEWFGLRRRLFYWHLHRKVEAMRKWRESIRGED